MTINTIAEFDADCHQRSANQVADGGMPIVRLAAGTLTVDPEATVVLGSGKSGAVRVLTQSRGLPSKHPTLRLPSGINLEAQTLADMFTSTGLVDTVLADQATVRAVAKILAASADTKIKRLARIVTYLAKQPAINQCAVLTTALAAKFWSPSGPRQADDLTMWSQAFGLDGTGRFDNVRDLVSFASVGESPVIRRSDLRTSSQAVTSALLRGNKAKVDAFESLQSHGDLWSAVEGSDPHLYRRGLLVGSTVAMSPIKRNGIQLVADVSTPFKLRTGSEILVFCPDKLSDELIRGVLNHMDFDTETDRLQVELGPPRIRTKKSSAASADSGQWERLCSRTNFGRHDLFAITAPYMGWSGFRGGRSRNGAQAANTGASSREVPLDVALAAAG